MAGRGRELTLPAWMRQEEPVRAQEPVPAYADAGRRDAGYGRRDEPRREERREDSRREERRDDGRREERRDESRREERKDDRRDDGYRRSDRDSRSDRRDDRDRRERSDRGGDRRRRDRSRSNPRRDDRGGRRAAPKGEFKKMEGFGVLSLSGSGRVRVRRFDILPPGVTPETAAAYAAEVIMQHKIAALSGIVGPASFGPPSNSHMQHLAFGANQHSRHARRLYVGGFGEITEPEIERFFNEVIDKALGEKQEHGSVVSVYINRERHFAFVELKSIELTTACMELDGISYKGQPLKIRRPNDYNPNAVKETGPIPKLDVNALGIVSTSVSDGPGKIFVGGLPYHLNEEQVKELLQAFGPLKSFHLVKEPNSNLSKGYGFCEYMDPAITQIACAGLNDMQVGDKTLTVRTALSAGGLYPPMFNPNTGMSNAPMPGVNEPDVNKVLANIQNHQQQTMQIVPSVPLGMPSRVIVLLNMVTTEDLTDPEEYQDICDDIRAECEKSGPIREMVVPRPNDPQYQPSSVCKVFIEFADMKSAQNAANELHGRGFANRTVAVEFMAEDKFARRDF